MSTIDYKEEYRKCSESPEYFIKEYINITHPLRGRVPFALYRFQERIVSEIKCNRFNIIRKFRQAGVTTIMCAYALWYIIFKKNKNIMVVSIGDREACLFLERVVEMYEDLPPFLKPKVTTRNAHNFRLSTGGKIKSQPAGAGRSEAVSLLIVDEAAFIDGMREFWKAVWPTISTGGECVMLSTVNGMSNLYYELYKEASEGKNIFNVIDIHWREHPDYDDEWSKINRPILGERGWLQEVEGQFLGTGDTFIDRDTLGKLVDGINDNYTKAYNHRFRIWKEPVPGYEYIMAVDPSYGVERDHSAFHIICLNTGEQVAEFYSSRTKVREFSHIIYEQAMAYNMAIVACERNSIGIILIQDLFEVLEYENMWFDEKGQIGVLMTKNGREMVLESLQNGLHLNKIKVNSRRTVDEITTFITTDSGRIEADKDYYDDLVTSLGISFFVIDKIEMAGQMPLMGKQQPLGEPTYTPLMTSHPENDVDKQYEDYRKWVLS